MPTSQLRVFSSYDSGAPQLRGISGSLVDLFDAVLVNGYGGTSSLGWTKPLANDASTGSLGCWQQPSGSRMILYINDAAPTGSINGGTREAWACGYESILGLTSSVFPTTGTGGGQFPTGSQITPGFVSIANGGVTSSSLWWRKSATNESSSRYWTMFGDSSTFYLFVQAGDTYGVYYVMWFGDIYSFKANDPYRCMIHGRMADTNNSSIYRFDASDLLMSPLSTAWPCFFMVRGFNGIPGSAPCNKVGDRGKNLFLELTTPAGSSEAVCEWGGLIPLQADNGLLLSPIFVADGGTGHLRGKMRGLYHTNHIVTSFTDGQVLTGSNEYAGKVFQVIKTGPFTNAGVLSSWVVEISNTVDTN